MASFIILIPQSREKNLGLFPNARLRRADGLRCSPRSTRQKRKSLKRSKERDCANSFSRHNVGAMHPRTVGRPPRRTLVCPTRLRTSCQRELRSRHAFTLIELLVVIAMIAILIGLFFPAWKAVQNQARKAQAKNDLTQVVNAVNAFYTEYGKYPLVTVDTIYGPAANPNNTLFNELRATAAATQNPRQIVFISPAYVRTPTKPRLGIATQATTINGIAVAIGDLVDPWGTPYNVKIDGNYDNQLANPYTADTGAGPGTLNIGVIAWSWGSNQTQGTANFKASDDVISWQ
jgi:prepilin-type N-terminal cleavage/methylation domain-containing protein